MPIFQHLLKKIEFAISYLAHGSHGAGFLHGSLIFGSFVSGIIISFLEAACTGQTYMPIISALVADNTTASKGYWLLLVYNILFIIPLLAVFLAVFFGMTSEQIGNLARRRVWITKAVLGTMFLAIAVWLGSILLPTIINFNSDIGAVKSQTSASHAPYNSPANTHEAEIDENTDR